jgi:hypothetical protein
MEVGWTVIDVALGATVTDMGVTDAGTWVGIPVAGIAVFVDMTVGSVVAAGGVRFTVTSQANIVAIKMGRNKNVFLAIVLCIVEFPFERNGNYWKSKTPLSVGEFYTG